MRCAATRALSMRPQLHLLTGAEAHCANTFPNDAALRLARKTPASCPQTSDQSSPRCASRQIKANGSAVNSAAQPGGGGKTAVSSFVREPNYSSAAQAGLDPLTFAERPTHENDKELPDSHRYTSPPPPPPLHVWYFPASICGWLSRRWPTRSLPGHRLDGQDTLFTLKDVFSSAWICLLRELIK